MDKKGKKLLLIARNIICHFSMDKDINDTEMERRLINDIDIYLGFVNRTAISRKP
jgi:hypothetical protein